MQTYLREVYQVCCCVCGVVSVYASINLYMLPGILEYSPTDTRTIWSHSVGLLKIIKSQAINTIYIDYTTLYLKYGKIILL